jgi:hypothetical protein
MKKINFHFFVVVVVLALAPGFLPAQTHGPVEDANEKIDRTQAEFVVNASNLRIDPGVRALMTRMLTVETDSIQQVIPAETTTTIEQKVLALHSHLYFLQAAQYAILNAQFEQYHIRDARLKYWDMWERLRHGRPYDDVMQSLGRRRTYLMAQAFREYPDAPRIADLSECRKLVYSPETIIPYLIAHPDFRFADSMIWVLADKVPELLADFMKTPKNKVLESRIRNHPHPLVQAITTLAPERFVRNYLPFAVEFMNKELNIADIDKLRMEPTKYYQKMVDHEMRIMAEEQEGKLSPYRLPLRAYLRQYSVASFINGMNLLHDANDQKDRFSGIEGLRPEDIYMIIVHGGDDFYTSSYIQTYNRLISTWGRRGGTDSLIRYMHYGRVRQFIRLAGRFNTLPDFMKRMPRDTLESAVRRFIYGLESYGDVDMEETMNVSESFTSLIKDPSLSAIVEVEIEKNRQRCEAKPNFYGMKLYGILNEIFIAVRANETGDTSAINSRLSSYLKLPHFNLQSPDSTVYQLVLFYGDGDGKSSFNSFLTNFKDPTQWEIKKNEQWIEVRSKKLHPVVIFANLPLNNDLDLDKKAQDTLLAYLNHQDIHPRMVIHRGHSYHLMASVHRFDSSLKLAILGSCGGYQEIFEVQRRSENAQVIATKQVGSMSVNEPMIRLINEYLLQRRDIDWNKLWKQLDARLKPDKRAHALFEDYIPPHKNIGMFVVKIYQQNEE